MSRATPIEDMLDWARDVGHSFFNSTSPFEKFWNELLVELGTGIEALKVELGAEAISFERQDGSEFVKISFRQHELRLLNDSRSGQLRYSFASPEIELLDSKETTVTSKGLVVVDPMSSIFKLKTVPELHLNPERRPGWAPWTLTNQLAQLLLQRLISPNYEDDRFRPTAS